MLHNQLLTHNCNKSMINDILRWGYLPMKKTLTLLTVVALALPLAMATVPANAQSMMVAANTQIKHITYTIVSHKTFKTAKNYHTNSLKSTVYQGLIAADQPTINLTAKSHLKAYTTYKVTQQVKVKLTSKKQASLSYIKGHGWVRTDTLSAGKLTATKYTILSSSFYKTAKTYHTKDAKPVVYQASIAADRPTMTLKAKRNLKSSTTYKVTKQVKLKATTSKKNRTFVYVKGQGWVLKSSLTAGQFKRAD